MENKFLHHCKNIRYFVNVKKSRRRRAPPNSILFPVIWVTNRCNARCQMCDQWKADPVKLSQELTTQEWYSVIDSTSRMHAAVIVITGGEPLLRPDIFDILKYIHKKGLASHLITNGILLDENTVNKLKDSGADSVSVSLDSDRAEIHNKMRGTDCFDTVVKGIKFLRQRIPEIKIGINYVITRQNFRNLDSMIPFAEKLEVNQIKFDPVHTNLAQRHKEPSSFRDLLFAESDLSELRLEIDKLIPLSSRTRLLTNSTTFLKGILNQVGGVPHGLRCYAGYISCAIDALGWVAPCDNFDGKENVRDKPLEEIWKSPSFQELRQRVHDCNAHCWDTTHAELNIRCSLRKNVQEFGQILKEIRFYFSRM